MYFLINISYDYVAVSDILETKHEVGMKIQERTEETEKVTSTALSLLDIVLGVYYFSNCIDISYHLRNCVRNMGRNLRP